MKIINDQRAALDKYAARVISEKISNLDKPNITLALPGGRSVNGIFQQLIEHNVNWQKIHIFLTDERIVPLNDKASNFRQLNTTLLTNLRTDKRLPAGNIHVFPTEEQNQVQAIANYSRQLVELGGFFDIILLSAGEDGHIASLFPDHPSVRSNSENYILVENSPKPPPLRVSISRKLLLRSTTAILLFYGAAKQNALQRFWNKNIEAAACPAKYCSKIADSHLLTDQEMI